MPYLGGTATYVYEMASKFAKKNTVKVIAPYYPNLDDKNYPFSVIRLRHTSIYKIRYYLGRLQFLLTVLMFKPDYVFITDLFSLKLADLFLKFNTFTHTSFIIYGTEIEAIHHNSAVISKKEFIALIQRIKRIIIISNYTKSLLLKRFPDINNETALLYPTVTDDYLSQKFTQAEEQTTLNKYHLTKNSYFLSVGRLVKRKGHHIIIPLLSIISKHTSIKYVIAGTGNEENNLTNLAKHNSVEQSVILTGAVSEKEKKILIKNCLFYIQPSIESTEKNNKVEGFGIALLEAFALHKTAVIFPHGGMTEIVENGINGLVSNDQKNILQNIISLLDDEKKRNYLETNALKTYNEEFSPKKFEKQLQTLI